MGKSRKKYAREFKEETVRYLLDSGKTIQEVADRLGIKYYLLSRWKKEYLKHKDNAFPGQGNPKDKEIFEITLR